LNITKYSYRFAEAVLSDSAFRPSVEELLAVLRAAQPTLYPVERVKIRSRGRGPIQALPVDQKELNRLIESQMPKGWEIRPLVVSRENSAGPTTNIKSDFKKNRIQVEVQFGNMARWYTDVFKFQLAYSLDSIDVGILVVPTHRFANLIDENVASYERVLRELPWAKMSLTLPILVLGVEPEDYGPVRERYEEAGRVFLSKPGNEERTLRPFEDALVAADEEPDQ